MFKLKPIFLYVFLGTLWSCGQDPLKDFPQEMKEGVLKTGFHHFANFEDALIEKLLKVDVVGRNDLTMDFSEGIEKSYTLKFRLLNDFSTKYEIVLSENPFSGLENSKWTYDFEKQIGVLKWKPSETFTLYQQYVQQSIPLSIKIKKRGYPKKDHVFTVNRNFSVYVNKRYTAPKIYRVKMPHDSYVNLTDGKWYRDYLLEDLNLNFFDELYLGEKIKTEFKDRDNFIFYMFDLYTYLGSVSDLTQEEKDKIGFFKTFDYFILKDKTGEEVSVELLPFINEPYYHVIDTTKTNSVCISEQPNFLKQALCLSHLKELDSVKLSEELYVKHYSKPDHIQKESLYYKVNSQKLCAIYYKISASYIVHNEKQPNLKETCYLSWDKLNAKNIPSFEFLSSKRMPITEKQEIYLLNSENDFELVNKSEWPFVFYKLPEHIIWQLGGQRPISLSSESPTLPVTLNRKKIAHSLEFYFKDKNISDSPYLVFEEKPGYLLIQNIPFKWTLKESPTNSNNIWRRYYFLNYTKALSENKYNKLYDFLFNVRPISFGIKGQDVKLRINVLPAIKVEYIDSFIPEENFRVSTQIQKTEGIEEWIGSDISIENQIKTKYIFSAGFKENVLKAMPFIPEAEKKKQLKDFIIVKDHKPQSNFACSKVYDAPFLDSICECSDFIYYEKNLSAKENSASVNLDRSQSNPLYMESICSYKSKLKLNPEDTTLDGELISAYWNYSYSVNSSLALKSFSLEERNTGISLSADRIFSRESLAPNEKDDRFRLHLFFNLEPKIKCISKYGSSHKICNVRYYFHNNIGSINIHNLNEDQLFFSEQGVQVNALCLDPNSREIKDCICGKPKFVTESKNIISKVTPKGSVYSVYGGEYDAYSNSTYTNRFLEIKCSMKKATKGFLSVGMKTNNPYIYFLDPEPNDDIKSTVLKKLSIK